jgi:hypothetical protein
MSLPAQAEANLEPTQRRPQLALADEMVDYWRMDEVSGDLVGAANGKTFTVVGAVTNAAGKVYATARQFPGVGTLGVGSRDNNDVRFSDMDVTFVFWWYQYTQPLGSGNNLYHYIWHQDDYYGGYTIGLNRGDQLFVQSGSGDNQFDTLHSEVISTPTNTWHFAIVWYDSTARQLHLRIDNGPDQFTSASPHAMGEFPARIGSSYTTDNVMDGRIGPIAVWNRLLNASEMSQLWNNGNGLAYPFLGPNAVAVHRVTAHVVTQNSSEVLQAIVLLCGGSVILLTWVMGRRKLRAK